MTMSTPQPNRSIEATFKACYQQSPAIVASAPGRLEVLGNHTDYNAGVTLSCAVGFRCYAALAPLAEPVAQLASTMDNAIPKEFPIAPTPTYAPPGHWANYILGLVGALQERGHAVPGFNLLVDSDVPRSAGVSSSAALEMAVLTGLTKLMQLGLPPIELARIGQWAESHAVGAQTGLLDQLTSLCGRRNHLLHTDFQSLEYKTIALPPGWAFVAIDSGVKHDLTQDYNDRRASCKAAAAASELESLRGASVNLLDKRRGRMSESAFRCATHIIGENHRVREAINALADDDMHHLGLLLFESHASSQDHFQNSCPELDELVEYARMDDRCLGARLSGGGFGGISIHLVRADDAEAYCNDLLQAITHASHSSRWSAICRIDDGADIKV